MKITERSKNQKIESMAKIPSRGVFWLIDGQLYCYPFIEDESNYGVSKSGNTFNHKKLWEYVRPKGCNKQFDYYPRGRVEINAKGHSIIYMNPNISLDCIPEIKVQFGLRDTPKVNYDFSEHYRCHLDEKD